MAAVGAGRTRDAAATRTRPGATGRTRPSRRQTTALVAVFALVAGAVTVAALAVRPDDARSFDLFDGSVLLADAVAPVAVDLASGQPTVRLVDAGAQVGARRADDVSVVPLHGASGGALLVDRRTGQFNLVDPTGFVAKKNGGVPLTPQAGATTAFARAAGGQLAYVTRTGPRGSSVYLVGPGTVQSAAADAGAARVRPRAFGSLTEPVSSAPGAATTAGDDLWLLAGTGSTRTIHRLSLPADSAPGVRLRDHVAGRTGGPAAIATADGAVAVVDGSGLRLWHGDTEQRGLHTAPVAGLDTVLPASHTGARLAFLLHGSGGWSVLSVDRDGTDVRGPTRLRGAPADARMVAPAYSRGSLYTADAAGGSLWRVELDGTAGVVDGASSYPVVTQDGRDIEAGGFDDTTVYAEGPRVVVNSPNHLRAVVLFTDGSRAPVAFTKSDATTISSGGGAEALTRGRNRTAPQRTPAPGRARPAPRPMTPVNNQVDCASTSQTPHIPALDAPVPGSTSVQLTWTYPVTDRTDCVPSTYVVGVRQLSGAAPAPPARVTVNGQLGVNLTGLYPSSRYTVTVTAYLNGKGTSSAPIRVTTGPAGPTAPSGVAATVDANGAWSVQWRSCGTAGPACVPAALWRVVPRFCDARGLSGAPADVAVPADPTTTVQPPASLAGGDLLGRSLQFAVQGIGANGAVGSPSAPSGCAASWTAPQRDALRLSASMPGAVDAGTTTTTTLSLDLGADPVRAAGGVGATVTFTLDGPDGARTGTTTVDGRGSVLTRTFDDVRPGAAYTAHARVDPPGHPAAGVVVDAGAISTRAQWPGLGATASCTPNLLLTCNLTVQLTGLSSADTGGERLAVADGSQLRCGNATTQLDGGSLDQSSWVVTKPDVSQLAKLFGNCTVDIGLVEAGDDPSPLYFGGVPSPVASVATDLGPAKSLGAGAGDFTAAWSDQGDASATLDYTGSVGHADLTQLATDWTSTLVAPNGVLCDSTTSVPDPAAVPAGTCTRQYGDRTTGWLVRVTYSDVTDGDSHSVDVPVADGQPPGYTPCAPTNLQAAWGGDTRDQGVQVTADGDLGGCSGWTYSLRSSVPDDCTAASGPTAAPPQTLTLGCDDPADDGWQVSVSWHRPDGSSDHVDGIAVGGTPPPT